MFPEYRKLRSALEKWGKRWNLRDEWCFNSALEALSFSKRRQVEWGEFSWLYASVGRRYFDLRIDGFDPYLEPVKDFKARAWKSFEAALKEHIEQALTEAVGELPPARIRAAPNPDHLAWLVRRHVLGHKFATIQADYPHLKTPKAIEQGVKRTAALIGLTLRTRASRTRRKGRFVL
jgi:hypothetical protein